MGIIEDIGFDLGGKQISISEPRCCAKQYNGRYYVRTGTGGLAYNQLLNPRAEYYNAGDDMRQNKERGCRLYEFKSVNKDVFDNYVKYLETKNNSWFLQANRALVTGNR